MSSIFTFPNRIVFGAGTRAMLAEELDRLGVRRPLIVTDAGLEVSGLVDEVAVAGGIDGAPRFDDVQANPTEGDVLAGLDRYRAEGCDGVIGLGGGGAPAAGHGGPPPVAPPPPPPPPDPADPRA